MLTREEFRLTLSFFKVFSILNFLPIGVDVKNGKIERQFNGANIFMWKILFGIGISHSLYLFGRLVQSTVLEPQKYFRWDHFVLHFGITCGYFAFYFTGFRLFVKNPEENVIVFNQLFVQEEDPVQKMIDQQLQIEIQSENENKVFVVSAPGNKIMAQSGSQLSMVSSAREPHHEMQGQDEVIENPSETESESEVCSRSRPLLTWPPQYSLDELVDKLFPPSGMFTWAFAVLILAIDSSRPQILYSVLPPEYQNFWSFIFLLAVEAMCLVMIIITGGLSNLTQLMFFGKCQLEFQRMSLQLRNLEEKFQSRSLAGGRDIEREIWILRQILKEMREVVLFIELFNRCFPFCTFAWKIFSLSVSITFYFFMVRNYENFPFLSVFGGYIAIVLTLIYTVMYRDAFSIPGKMDEFLLTARKTIKASTLPANSNLNANLNKNLRAEMKREVKRIRGVGIKVGSFHQMERESTPNFVDFVFRNVVSLLVTFPR